MRLLEYVDLSDIMSYVTVDDISAVIDCDDASGSIIYLKSDPKAHMITKYKPSVVIQGRVVEI